MSKHTGDAMRPVWEIAAGPMIRTVLVSPQNAGNIGAAARAIRVSGFDQLALVDSNIPLDKGQAYAMAWGSVDLLENSLKVKTLEEALEGCNLAVATTARPRRSTRMFVDPADLAQELLKWNSSTRVAIVFGREDSGLSNDEMDRCEWWTRIPSAAFYPSYNLAQAVQIVLYELFKAFSRAPEMEPRIAADPQAIEWLFKRIRDRLEANGFVPRDGMDEFINHARGVLGDIVTDRHSCQYLHKLMDGILGERTN